MSPAPIPSNKSRVPSQPKRFPCPLQGCPKSFSQRAGLNSHLVTHTGNRQYICEVCSKSYTTNNRLTVHKRTHSGERPYKCSEPGCNYAATQKCTLKNHLQTHLDIARKREIKFLNMRTVPCLTCGKLYKTVESLAHHAKTEH
ncbi:hypothetical protein BC830DRAFT_1071444 [Chytriomyces sp. MP71]|nr:hypothetical protein BC830DRAFT_1071444 [Chytriomyces sp. MP71]